MSRNAERQSFAMVPETCPKVDAALESAAEAIKEQTGALRNALIDALDRAEEAESKVEEQEEVIERLRDEIATLQRELDEAEAHAT